MVRICERMNLLELTTATIPKIQNYSSTKKEDFTPKEYSDITIILELNRDIHKINFVRIFQRIHKANMGMITCLLSKYFFSVFLPRAQLT